jgi:hypothetical protein
MNVDTKPRPAAELSETELAGVLDKIADQMVAIEAEIGRLEARSKDLALDSAAGSQGAKVELTEVRARQAAARQELEDLRSARSDAVALIAQKATARRYSEDAEERLRVQALCRDRIKAAADFDAAALALEDAYGRFARLGNEILNSPGNPVNLSAPAGLSAMEGAHGHTRVMAALPGMIRAFFPTAIFPAERHLLARSERAMWGSFVNIDERA